MDTERGGAQHAVSQVVVENPIINSPFEEPTRHFRFGDEGITNEIVDGRRTSSYFVPIAPTANNFRMKFIAGCHRQLAWTLGVMSGVSGA